jgi:hypothetical protein
MDVIRTVTEIELSSSDVIRAIAEYIGRDLPDLDLSRATMEFHVCADPYVSRRAISVSATVQCR